MSWLPKCRQNIHGLEAFLALKVDIGHLPLIFFQLLESYSKKGFEGGLPA